MASTSLLCREWISAAKTANCPVLPSGLLESSMWAYSDWLHHLTIAVAQYSFWGKNSPVVWTGFLARWMLAQGCAVIASCLTCIEVSYTVCLIASFVLVMYFYKTTICRHKAFRLKNVTIASLFGPVILWLIGFVMPWAFHTDSLWCFPPFH